MRNSVLISILLPLLVVITLALLMGLIFCNIEFNALFQLLLTNYPEPSTIPIKVYIERSILIYIGMYSFLVYCLEAERKNDIKNNIHEVAQTTEKGE